jgi:cobalt/nickel transport system permease protein
LSASKLEQWSRGSGFLHRRDASVKILTLAAYLVFTGTAHPFGLANAAWYFSFVAMGAMLSGAPLTGLLSRVMAVLPFTLAFFFASLASGDSEKAWMFVAKSLFSALAVLVIMATTPMAALLRGAEKLGAPRMLVLVIQFLMQYIFALPEKARSMARAASCRGGWRVGAAAGAISVLFGSSYRRAEGIHQAMLARGFEGRFLALENSAMNWIDVAMLVVVAGTLLAARLLWGI